MSLQRYVHLLMPAIRQWESQCPRGTRIEIARNDHMDTIEIAVNGEIVGVTYPYQLAHDVSGTVVENIRHCVFEAANRRDRDADDRSEQLLRSHLTEAQIKTLDSVGHFEVIGNETGTTYRIKKPAEGRNVVSVHNGKPFMAYDAKPMMHTGRNTPGALIFMAPLPWGDTLLGQKLVLENEEYTFLKTACSMPLTGAVLHQGGGNIINNGGLYNLNWVQMNPAQLNAAYVQAFAQAFAQHEQNNLRAEIDYLGLQQTQMMMRQQAVQQHAGDHQQAGGLGPFGLRHVYPPQQGVANTPEPDWDHDATKVAVLMILGIFAVIIVVTSIIHLIFQ